MSIIATWDPDFYGIDDDEAEAFQQFLGEISLTNLARVAAQVCGVNPATCSTNGEIFQRGSHNVAFEIAFADGVSWVARVRLPYAACLHPVNDALQRAHDEITLVPRDRASAPII